MLGYSEWDIERQVGRQAAAAGRVYSLQGRVLSFEREGDVINGLVHGNERQPYEQTIELTARASVVSIAGDCSCPVGFNCKHVAAVLLKGLARGSAVVRTGLPGSPSPPLFSPPSPSPPTRDGLPLRLASWLDDLDRARATAEEAYPETIHQRLVYVLSPMPAGLGLAKLGVSPISARRLKDGTFSSNGRPYGQGSAGAVPAKFLRPSDRRILQAMSLIGREYGLYTGTSLAGEAGATVLPEILATGRARWGDHNGPVLAAGPARPGRIAWQPVGEAAMAPMIQVDEGLLSFSATPPVYLDLAAGTVGPIETGYPPKVAAALLAAPEVPIEAVAALNEALVRRAPELAGARAPDLQPDAMRDVAPVPMLTLTVVDVPVATVSAQYWTGYAYHVPTETIGLARLSFRYRDVLVPFGDDRAVLKRLVQARLIELHRDLAAEGRAAELLGSHGFAPAPELRRSLPAAHARDFLPANDELAWLDVLYHVVPDLRALGWEVEIAPDFPVRLLRVQDAVQIDVRERSGIDWLDLDFGVEVDGERIDLVGPIVALLSRPGFDPANVDDGDAADEEPTYLPLGDGRILAFPAARLTPIVAAIRDLFLGGGAEGGGRLGISRADAAGLAALEAASLGAGAVWSGGEQVRAMARKLAASGGIPAVALPASFRAALRPYQQDGVAWLAFLRDAGFGGVLADDMGLGKTVQALAFVAIEKAEGRLDRPALVIAPTSLMGNWRREAERFAPDLRVLTLHGLDRHSRFDAIAESDLVLTTYPLIARDHATLGQTPWHLLILDEAQTIKNPDAATTKLIGQIEARHRFCLTGTPLENNLGELWSLFSFACPGLLGDRRGFTRTWRSPIEKGGDRERSRLLARRVKPFLMRRSKSEVARELPSKTEIVERIELEPAQRDLYESVRLSMHERVRAAIAAKGWARSSIIVLDALLKLRQACCDPRLVKLKMPRRPGSRPLGSAKLDRLDAMLTELLAEGRRVLVFSQFTSMLALIQERLDAARTPYALLTGDTRDRDGAVRSFEEGRADVFLVSLKAGGTGLNLTAADTVILYDPWWNPAVEDQAIDRAHRIGQTKPVFVHKLVAVGTIEEKMEVLKERKSALARSLFDHEGAPTAAMTEADLDMLLS